MIEVLLPPLANVNWRRHHFNTTAHPVKEQENTDVLFVEISHIYNRSPVICPDKSQETPFVSFFSMTCCMLYFSICSVVALWNVSGAAHSLASCAPWQNRVGDLRWLMRETRGDGAHTAMERSLLAVTAMTQKDFRILPSASRLLSAFLAIWLR